MCETRLSRIEFRTPVARHADLCRALLGDIPGVSVVDGKFLEGCVADAVIAPTNGFGHLDTLIEGAFARRFGRRLQRTLQERFESEYDAELEVGCAAIVPTGDLSMPFVAMCPLTGFPGTMPKEPPVGRSLLAGIRAIEAWNAADEGPTIESVVVPDMAMVATGWESERVFMQVREAMEAWQRETAAGVRRMRAA